MKKICVLVFCLVLAASLVACGQPEPAASPAASAEATAVIETKPAPAPVATEAPSETPEFVPAEAFGLAFSVPTNAQPLDEEGSYTLYAGGMSEMTGMIQISAPNESSSTNEFMLENRSPLEAALVSGYGTTETSSIEGTTIGGLEAVGVSGSFQLNGIDCTIYAYAFISDGYMYQIRLTTFDDYAEVNVPIFDEILSSLKITSAPAATVPENADSVLVDQDGIKITYTGLDTDGMMGTEIKLRIENNSDVGVLIQTRDMSVNGMMLDGIFSSEVNAGKKANDKIIIPSWGMEDNDITDLEEVEFYFTVVTSEGWDKIFDSDTITLTF